MPGRCWQPWESRSTSKRHESGAYHARVRVFRLQDKARNPSVVAARTQGQKRAKRAGVCLSAREEHTILHGSNPRTNQTHSSPEHGWIDCGNQSDSSWMGKLLLQGTCPKTIRQVGSVDNAANLEPLHEAVAKQRLEIPTGTTALWRDGTGKLDSSHSFLTTEQMLTIVKAGCGKSARPVWEADGGQHPRRASSDPTAKKRVTTVERRGLTFRATMERLKRSAIGQWPSNQNSVWYSQPRLDVTRRFCRGGHIET